MVGVASITFLVALICRFWYYFPGIALAISASWIYYVFLPLVPGLVVVFSSSISIMFPGVDQSSQFFSFLESAISILFTGYNGAFVGDFLLWSIAPLLTVPNIALSLRFIKSSVQLWQLGYFRVLSLIALATAFTVVAPTVLTLYQAYADRSSSWLELWAVAVVSSILLTIIRSGYQFHDIKKAIPSRDDALIKSATSGRVNWTILIASTILFVTVPAFGVHLETQQFYTDWVPKVTLQPRTHIPRRKKFSFTLSICSTR